MKKGLLSKLFRTAALSALALCVLAVCLPAGAVLPPEDTAVYSVEGRANPETGYLDEFLVDENGNRVTLKEEQLSVDASHSGGASPDSSLPSSYDSRDYDIVTPVKDQGESSSCWAFNTIAAAEISSVKQGFATLSSADYSESHLAWFTNRSLSSNPSDSTSGDGVEVKTVSSYKTGNNVRCASATLARGSGLETETHYPFYNVQSKFPLMSNYTEGSRYSSAMRLYSSNRYYDIDEIKQAVMDYGSVTCAFDSSSGSFNTTYHSYYQSSSKAVDHGVLIVGWDDNFSSSWFDRRPPQNGAFLCKNSWGTSTQKNDKGYFWLSYSDPSVTQFFSIETAPLELFDTIYQYDGYAWASLLNTKERSALQANIFTAADSDELAFVSFWSYNKVVDYTIKIYTDISGSTNPKNGTPVSAATTSGRMTVEGYHTVPLAQAVELETGEKFSVVIEFSLPDGADDYLYLPFEGNSIESSNPDKTIHYSSKTGQSFYRLGSSSDWKDSSSVGYNNVCIKALTRESFKSKTLDRLILENEPNNTSVYVGGELNLGGLVVRALFTDGSLYPLQLSSLNIAYDFSTTGTKTVTVSLTHNGVTKNVAFNVNVRERIYATGVKFSQDSIRQKYSRGGTISLGYTVYPTNADNKNCTLTVNGSGVVSPDGDARLAVKGRGAATVTVRTDDGGFEDSCKVEIYFEFYQYIIYYLLFGWIWY